MKKPAQIRVNGSLDVLRASRYAADPKAVVLTYIWACSESTITGDEVRTCTIGNGEAVRFRVEGLRREAPSFTPAAAAAASVVVWWYGRGADNTR